MKKIMFVVANQVVSPLTNWKIGFWLPELAHPFFELSKLGYDLTIASPNGGEVFWDEMSDPANPNSSQIDLVSMGFKTHPKTQDMLKNTKSITTVNESDFDGIIVVGGLSPMYTFVENAALQKLFAGFYEAGKMSATICHGSVILLNTMLKNGKLLAENKKWTGFSDAEETMIDKMAGKPVQPFRIETEAKKLNLNYQSGPAFKPYAIRDGNLITGQQGVSGFAFAALIKEFFA